MSSVTRPLKYDFICCCIDLFIQSFPDLAKSKKTNPMFSILVHTPLFQAAAYTQRKKEADRKYFCSRTLTSFAVKWIRKYDFDFVFLLDVKAEKARCVLISGVRFTNILRAAFFFGHLLFERQNLVILNESNQHKVYKPK